MTWIVVSIHVWSLCEMLYLDKYNQVILVLQSSSKKYPLQEEWNSYGF